MGNGVAWDRRAFRAGLAQGISSMNTTTNITRLLKDGTRESRDRVLNYYMNQFRKQAASLIRKYDIRRSTTKPMYR